METRDYLKPSLQKRQKRRDKRLDEELIECYRRGSRVKQKRGYNQHVKKNGFEHARKNEGIRFMHSGGTKYFNDNLQPLIRFLQSNTGKSWNKTYAALCAKLDRGSVSGLHVFHHIFDFVSIHVWIEGKKVYEIKSGGKTELVSWSKWPRFYVHPRTGILYKANNKIKQ